MLKNFFKEEFTLWKAQLTNTTGSPKKEYDQPIIILGKQSEKKVIMQKNAIDTLVSNTQIKTAVEVKQGGRIILGNFTTESEPVDNNFEIKKVEKKKSINGFQTIYTLYL